MTISKINIIDSTLREGNQPVNVSFSSEDSVIIANLLSVLGVDMIEIGHPYASQLELNRVRSVVNLNLNCEILSHARAREEDIYSVYESGAQWVGIFAGINTISQKYRFNNQDTENILKIIEKSVVYAKSLGLKVRYTVEDSSRTLDYFLIKAYETAIFFGADRICYADTVGTLEPKEVKQKISMIKSIFNVPLEVHFHDDRGLSMANTLVAIENGCSWVSTSVNGLGERCGIPDTCALIANLFHKGLIKKINIELLKEISKVISDISGSKPDHRRPVIGDNAFTHKAKLHQDATKKDKNAYIWFDLKNIKITQKLNICKDTDVDI